MFDRARFGSLVNKVSKATKKFKFVEAEKHLSQITADLEEADAKTKRLGDIEDWADVPAPVLWINNSRKSPEVLEKIKSLAVKLTCTCKPTACKCIPTSDANRNPKLRCRLCEDALTGNDVAWVDSQNYGICGLCNDILYDVLYPERFAADKIDKVVDSALWWTAGERPQFLKALNLIEEARKWCRIAANFPNAVP
ncbi:hypothetical protein BH10CYA1_BH10CYA1_64620 [soil metagenome]